jgi:hypothetical protein
MHFVGHGTKGDERSSVKRRIFANILFLHGTDGVLSNSFNVDQFHLITFEEMICYWGQLP